MTRQLGEEQNVSTRKQLNNKASFSRRRRTAGEAGQAALALVMGLMIILVTGASLLATNAINHDPLIQNDAIQHYAYRGLESGINTYLSSVNTNSNLINCNSNSVAGQCNPSDYGTWKLVQGTGTDNISEWYLWGNPVFCFNNACTINGGSASTNLTLLYIKVQMWGAAGVGSHIVYQSASENLTPVNGFLTRIWWANYEATDPTSAGYSNTDGAYCTHDWNNNYNGANTTGANACSEVYFDAGAKIYGPIFSNDSIYVSGNPTLGPVTTHDPSCLFVTGTGGKTASCQTNNSSVTQSAADAAGDKYNQPLQPIPTTDSSLATIAKLNGCYYQGPTTLHFNATAGGAGTMNVWSPDSTSSSTAADCLPSTAGAAVNVPNGANGNGVIYVGNAASTACVAGANPYDNWTSGTYGSNAQLNYKGTYTNFFGAQPSQDCEGDAFVGDSPTGGGIAGQLTVASANNVVVTNDLEYVDCGTNFTANYADPHDYPCTYNPTGNNDSLGLIATNYVEVNHPVVPAVHDDRRCQDMHGGHVLFDVGTDLHGYSVGQLHGSPL